MHVRVFVLAVVSCAFLLQSQAIAEDLGGEATRSWFAVQINVGPNWDESISPYEQPFFKEHSAHLNELRSAGHIVMGSRYSDVGLLIFHAKSAEDISALMDEDPSMEAGTFSYEVFPMNVFYPGFVGDKK
ncbi:MAG: hypothetical protein AAF412_14870 [Pseudomonadota bacterium]